MFKNIILLLNVYLNYFNSYQYHHCIKNISLAHFFGYLPSIRPLIASAKTMPNIDPPSARYTILKTTNSSRLLAINREFDINAHFIIHSPGNINMKTAERLPSTLITAPMFGITSASTNDKTNHTVTQT